MKLFICAVVGALALASQAQITYQTPPDHIKAVMEALRNPAMSVSPAKDRVLLIQRERYLDIAEMAQPMVPLAGLRINPDSHRRARLAHILWIKIKDIQTGKETPVDLPKDTTIWTTIWAPDGKHFAFPAARANRTEVWVTDMTTGKCKLVAPNANAALGSPIVWMPDSRHMIVHVPAPVGTAPTGNVVPGGPEMQESLGRKRPARTFPDILKDTHDDQLFDYYMTAQLQMVDTATGRGSAIGKPGIYSVDPSPDGNLLLVNEVRKPYSHRLPLGGFASHEAIWNLNGVEKQIIADRPNEEGVPLDGVPTGPRGVEWRADQPETLFWVEALDNGDPKANVPARDKLVLENAQDGKPHELLSLKERFQGIQWIPSGNRAFVEEYDRENERNRRYLVQLDAPNGNPRLVSDLNTREQYANPGNPVQNVLPNGHTAVIVNGEQVLFAGRGASAEGDRPFLDTLNLDSLQSRRVWRCDADHYETVADILTPDGKSFLTLKESASDYPNYFLHTGEAVNAFTNWSNPFPDLLQINKQLVTYKRSDGVQCSFTLYTPPGYKAGEKLPAIVWAYPLEFTNASTAGQVTGSTKTFPILGGPQLFALAGYAVLYNMTTPIVGTPETVNDTFISQLVDDAKAGIEKAAELGVVDPNRVGVMGHSYGAFMTANLLAHCDLFKAGAAESGAYNRTLTPFGFQSERRTYWQAPKMYNDVSPFMVADKVKHPILLIHGEQDDNPGTYTIQSERFFSALSGNGATVRLVLLPYEAHGYAAKQSLEHVLWEELRWFDKYVKGTATVGQ